MRRSEFVRGGVSRVALILAALGISLFALPLQADEAPKEGEAKKAEAKPVEKAGGETLVPGTKGGLPKKAAGKRSVVREGREGMGTFMEMLVATDKAEEAKKVIDEAFKEMARIEALMSEYQEGSEVAKINKAAGGDAVPISKELLDVLKTAQKVSEASEGAFDVTWAALHGLWRFDTEDPKVPTDEEIKPRLKLIGYKHLILTEDPPTAKLDTKDMSIGLGGIAKGYAVDRAAAMLRAKGFEDFIVYAGGDLYISGNKTPGRPWTVGMQHPRVRGALISAFPAPGGAVVTSGDYERFFMKDGKRYHHIIDLKTGKPAHLSMAVTVMAKDAVMADAISTAIFILGPVKGIELAEKTEGVDAVVIDPKGKAHMSSGVQGKIKVQDVKVK